jgi:hypothetical protein
MAKTFVSVDSVHAYVSPFVSTIGLEVPALRDHLYLDNTTDIVPNVAVNDLGNRVEYDGMTIKLRGHVLLEASKNYKIRIVIADAQDESYDSAIFIQNNSVRTIQPTP